MLLNLLPTDEHKSLAALFSAVARGGAGGGAGPPIIMEETKVLID